MELVDDRIVQAEKLERQANELRDLVAKDKVSKMKLLIQELERECVQLPATGPGWGAKYDIEYALEKLASVVDEY